MESFAKCIRIAYCLRLIPSAFKKNLEALAKVRNTFAHSDRVLDFTDQRVIDHCKNLKPPKNPPSTMTKEQWEEYLKQLKSPNMAFRNFIGICFVSTFTLIGIGGMVEPTKNAPCPLVSWDDD